VQFHGLSFFLCSTMFVYLMVLKSHYCHINWHISESFCLVDGSKMLLLSHQLSCFRVLKRGGRFLCLELSHVDVPVFKEM
jgi:hypothetical protein